MNWGYIDDRLARAPVWRAVYSGIYDSVAMLTILLTKFGSVRFIQAEQWTRQLGRTRAAQVESLVNINTKSDEAISNS